MIIETGRVTKVESGKAFVEIARGTACSECHVGCACELGKSTILVEANDPIGVQVDQQVQMAIQPASVLRASFVVYMVPLFALILGTLFGKYLGTQFGVKDIPEILGGFGFLGCSFLLVRYYNQVFKQDVKNQPVITKVL